jgi:hypothetical protein
MSGFTRTVQVTLGIRQLGAALVAFALAIVLAVVLANGQLTTPTPQTAPTAGAAAVDVDAGGAGSGGRNGTRLPQ